MSKPKLTLTASPTFVASVPIPIPGGQLIAFDMTFKGRTRDQLREFCEGLSGNDDVKTVMDICTGWELEDEFDASNIAILFDNYMGAAHAIIDVYFFEITRARLKNS